MADRAHQNAPAFHTHRQLSIIQGRINRGCFRLPICPTKNSHTLVNWPWFAIIYDSSVLGCRSVRRTGWRYCWAVATDIFVPTACFVFLNYCLLLWYHISTLLDDVSWMVYLFLNFVPCFDYFCFNRGFELSVTFVPSISLDNREMPVYMHACSHVGTHTSAVIWQLLKKFYGLFDPLSLLLAP
jgi:hypothetical protein